MSLSLCGGLGAGPIAVGSGSGNSLTLTLDRDVTCNGVLYIVAGAFSGPANNGPDSPDLDSVTDTASGIYMTAFSDFGCAAIGDIRQDKFDDPPPPPTTYSTLFYSGSALRSITAGGLATGDTIDLTFVSSFPGNVVTIAMAFLLTGVTTNAVAMTGLGVQYNESYAFPDEGAPFGSCTNTDLTYQLAWEGSPPLRTPVDDCALIAISLGYNGSGDYTSVEGVVLGQHSAGVLELAFSAIPSIAAASAHEPGGSWSSPYELAVGNWQFIGLPPPGPSLIGEFSTI